MSVALHPNHPDAVTLSGMPSNMEAEQAVLGAILMDNDAFHAVEGLSGAQFFEPFHGRLFDAIGRKVSAGQIADIILLADDFHGGQDRAFVELGGVTYLGELLDRAPHPSTANAYAKSVIEAAQRRDLILLSSDLGAAARDPAMPAEDAIGLAEAQLLAMQVHSRPMTLTSAGQAAERVLAYLDAPQEAVNGIRTGIAPLDEELGPLLPGNLVLLAGRPSMGKSAFAECVALNISEQGYGVIQINGEMSVEEMAQRHLTDIAHRMYGAKGPEYRDIRRRRIGYDQRSMLGKAHEVLQPLPLQMLKRPGLKLSQLRSIARRQAAAWSRKDVPLGALIVDHVGLLKPDAQVRDRYEAQTIISNSMKELADELGCPVIGLNQMNRENEKREEKRPQLSDLRDSGSWEQDADFVIGFYREAYYAQRMAEPKKDLEWAEWDRQRKSRTIEAIILKARSGACLTVKLWADVARNAIRGGAPEGELF
jgi:replicative DNA helicase